MFSISKTKTLDVVNNCIYGRSLLRKDLAYFPVMYIFLKDLLTNIPLSPT